MDIEEYKLKFQLETNDTSLIEEERDNSSSRRSALPASLSQNSILLADTSPNLKGIPSDPALFVGDFWEQWMHTGQYGLNTIPVWQDYTGQGVRVGLIDDGFNYNHSELFANFSTALDYDVLGHDFDSLNDSTDSHGTWTSQVIGADDNGIANIGIAYDSEIVGIRRGFGSEGTVQETLNAFQYALDVHFDIVNNSWGTVSAFGDNKNIDFTGTDSLDVINKFEDLVEFGRGGLGANIVFSAGNGREDGLSANYKNYQNSPYSIAVGAINQTGTYSYFSEAGANLLVSAPGQNIKLSSAFDNGSAVVVSGTSFSAPAVSGVIALMLEANPNLGYRDVQDILALSSRQIDAGGTGWANEGWQTNGATNFNGGGMHFSHDYGFGLVDARAAVRLAEGWTLQQSFANMSIIPPVSSSPALSIPATGVVTTSINITDDIDIEHMIIDLDISHTKAGDLTVTLISPDGTESVLMYHVNNGAYTTTYGVYNGVNFEFSSVASWGESSQGDWTLRIEDDVSGNAGTLNSWSLSFLGSAQSTDDLYVYTDEFFAKPVENREITDNDGGTDTLNAAAMTEDIILNLNYGGTLGSEDVHISAGTVIENVVTGDGDDFVKGNIVDNVLSGGRGDDRLYGEGGDNEISGGSGHDRLKGGAGNDILDGGVGSDRLEGGAGNDVLNGGEGKDILYGQEGDDHIYGGAENDVIRGNAGNDLIFGDIGNDKIYADEGEDEIHGGAGTDFVVGGQNDDIIYGDEDRDKLYGQEGNDEIHGGSGIDFLNGGSGDDILFGGQDKDKLYGLDGNDRLDGGAGNDQLYAGDGTDILIGGDGADRMYGSTGLDTFALTTYDTGLDRIYNYDLGHDKINITDILQGYDNAVDDLTDFIRFIGRADGHTELRVNVDGDAGGSYGRAAIIYTDFAGQDTNDLLTNGTLIAGVSA